MINEYIYIYYLLTFLLPFRTLLYLIPYDWKIIYTYLLIVMLINPILEIKCNNNTPINNHIFKNE